MISQADVLIVTATPVESRAVIETFGALTGQPSSPVSVGDRIYHDLGEVRETRVFLALTEMGATGLGACLQSVQKGIAALRPSAVIMVGIAFGMNEQKQAIGDILVSQQLLLYESQRLGEGKIILRGDKPHASTRLINYIESARLYWKESSITVRMGLILSGEKLVDNLDYREQLKQFGPEAIGGEMEGAGLYVACQDAKVDWILVKGICDWADGNKAQDQDARQRLAAHNAAAFVAFVLKHVDHKHDAGEDSSMNHKMPKEIIRECLSKSFGNVSEIHNFCYFYFEELSKRIMLTDDFETSIRRIIQYCSELGLFEYLWKCIKKERNNQYTKYYPEWERSIKYNYISNI